MRYAARWLRTVLREVAPWRRDIVAVALDDDQGAYIDNDTWPGPNFHRYISYLASVVRAAEPRTALFINTYDMKVTASAPVWAWGNWYQSDAYSIGEHDRTQLEFTTGLLQTQPHRPVMISEFQAGWLQDADRAVPRPADPTNTTLALHTLLQMGAHGIVNFPVEDTLNPAGWEAPWTNAFYSWDAALSVQLTHQARWGPTAAFGTLIGDYGAALAQTHRAADAAVAYLTSAYDPERISNDQIAQIAQATMDAQRGCRIVRLSCSLVDLRYVSERDLQRYPVLILPPNTVRAPMTARVRKTLAEYRANGGQVVGSARSAHVASPAAGGIPNAALLVSNDGTFAFLDIVNYAWKALHTPSALVHDGAFRAEVPSQTIAPRSAVLLPLNVPIAGTVRRQARASATAAQTGRIPLRSDSWIAARLPTNRAVFRFDVYRDGYPAVVMQNSVIRLIVSPCAGARALVFEDMQTGDNLFTTVGGLRDAWSQPLPASPRDYIAKYTHPIAAGTFNRCYAATIDTAKRSAVFSYTAPDAPPRGAAFRKRVTLDADGFTVTLTAAFPGSQTQHARQLTSFAIERRTRILRARNAVGFFDQPKQRLVAAVWPAADVASAALETHDVDALLTLTYAALRPARTRYAAVPAKNYAAAQAALRALANRP
jgi:hypothetical protein